MGSTHRAPRRTARTCFLVFLQHASKGVPLAQGLSRANRERTKCEQRQLIPHLDSQGHFSLHVPGQRVWPPSLPAPIAGVSENCLWLDTRLRKSSVAHIRAAWLLGNRRQTLRRYHTSCRLSVSTDGTTSRSGSAAFLSRGRRGARPSALTAATGPQAWGTPAAADRVCSAGRITWACL